MDWMTITPGRVHRYGRCLVEVSEVIDGKKRKWLWAVRWSEEDGIAGEADTLPRAQRLSARAAVRVAEIDRRAEAASIWASVGA
jgi:hypothetical protein